MKGYLSIYKPYMVRPLLYQAVVRFLAALTAALLWNRFVNTDGFLFLGKHAFFTAGMFLLATAWFSYLRLDGLRLHHLGETDRPKSRKKPHRSRDMVDFADEKVISFDELSYEEQAACRLGADLVSGVLMLGMAFLGAMAGI